jgi:heterogeneous nuclear ribonucleoprotein F/H
MRGLPYRATAQDIEEFFTPLPIVDILIGYGDDGRPSGEGAADFATPADAHNAMSRNQKLMGKRYIELFLGYGMCVF